MFGNSLYAERLKRPDEEFEDADWMMPGKSFRLRFTKEDFQFFKPHFKAIIEPLSIPLSPISTDDAIEGDFIVTNASSQEEISGFFHADKEGKVEAGDIDVGEYAVTFEEEVSEDYTENIVLPVQTTSTLQDVLPPGVTSLKWGIGLYYGEEVDALFITADTYGDAVKYTRDQKFNGFWYYVNSTTGWMSMIQQKDSVEKYNQMHYVFSTELIDEVNQVANDQALRDAAIKEGNLGASFIKLVKKAQDKVYGDKKCLYYGMYTAETRIKVKEEIKRQQDLQDELTSGENFEAHYGLTPYYTPDRITSGQIDMINRLSDTATLFPLSEAFQNFERSNPDHDITTVLNLRSIEPTWSFEKWDNWSRQWTDPYYVATRKQFESSDIPAERRPYFEMHAMLNNDWFGTDKNYVVRPKELLHLIIALENTKYYGGLVGGHIDDSGEFWTAYNSYRADVTQNLSLNQSLKSTTEATSFKTFYEQYLWTRTFEYMEEGSAGLVSEMSRYGVVEGSYVGEGPEIQALVTDLQASRNYYLLAHQSYSQMKPVGAFDLKTENPDPYKNDPNAKQGDRYRTQGFEAFNQLRTKYPILMSAEFGKQIERKNASDPIKYDQSAGGAFVEQFVMAATNDKNGRTATIKTLFDLYATRQSEIEKLKQKLYEKPYRVWQLQRAINSTMNELNFGQGSSFDEMIQSWQQKGIEQDTDYLTLVLAIGVGFLSIFFPVLLPVSIALGVKQFESDLDKTQFEHAAAGGTFDPNESLSAVEPSSYWWLLLDVAGIVLDGFQALQFVKIGTKAARIAEMLTSVQGKVETLAIDASNMSKYIEDVTAIVKAQVKDEKLQVQFIKYLTDEKAIQKIQAQELSRQALLESKTGVSLTMTSDLLKSLTADTEPLKDFYKAAMYRAQEIPFGNGKTLFAQIDEIYAVSNPDLAKRLLGVVGESEGMANSFKDICASVSKNSNGAFTMDHYVKYELQNLAGDNRQLFRNLEDYNVTSQQIDDAVQKASKGTTSEAAVRLLHDELISIVNTNKNAMREALLQGAKQYGNKKVMQDVTKQIDESKTAAADLKSKTTTNTQEVTNAGKPEQLDNAFHASKIDEYGETLVQKADNVLASDPARTDDLFNKFGAEAVYEETLKSGGNLDEVEKSLNSNAWSEWYENGINSETKLALKNDENIWVIYRNMDPRTRTILTMCASVCVPTKITELQAQRIDTLVKKFQIPDNDRTVIEYFHRYKAQLDDATNAIETELNKLGSGYKSEDVLRTFDETLTNKLIAEADAKGFIAAKTQDGWVLTPKGGGKPIYEYATGTYKSLKLRGTDHFFEAHHSIQKYWAKLRINTLNKKYSNIFKEIIYDEELAPSINLRDRRSGSPHRLITNSQSSREANASVRTYAQERDLMISDMQMAGVPQVKIDQMILDNDSFFKGLYDKVKDGLKANSKLSDDAIDNELFAIFGTQF